MKALGRFSNLLFLFLIAPLCWSKPITSSLNMEVVASSSNEPQLHLSWSNQLSSEDQVFKLVRRQYLGGGNWVSVDLMEFNDSAEKLNYIDTSRNLYDSYYYAFYEFEKERGNWKKLHQRWSRRLATTTAKPLPRSLRVDDRDKNPNGISLKWRTLKGYDGREFKLSRYSKFKHESSFSLDFVKSEILRNNQDQYFDSDVSSEKTYQYHLQARNWAGKYYDVGILSDVKPLGLHSIPDTESFTSAALIDDSDMVLGTSVQWNNSSGEEGRALKIVRRVYNKEAGRWQDDKTFFIEVEGQTQKFDDSDRHLTTAYYYIFHLQNNKGAWYHHHGIWTREDIGFTARPHHQQLNTEVRPMEFAVNPYRVELNWNASEGYFGRPIRITRESNVVYEGDQKTHLVYEGPMTSNQFVDATVDVQLLYTYHMEIMDWKGDWKHRGSSTSLRVANYKDAEKLLIQQIRDYIGAHKLLIPNRVFNMIEDERGIDEDFIDSIDGTLHESLFYTHLDGDIHQFTQIDEPDQDAIEIMNMTQDIYGKKILVIDYTGTDDEAMMDESKKLNDEQGFVSFQGHPWLSEIPPLYEENDVGHVSSLAEVSDYLFIFGIWMDGYNFEQKKADFISQVSNTTYDLTFTFPFYRDFGENLDVWFTPEDVEELKTKSTGESRLGLAYLSIAGFDSRENDYYLADAVEKTIDVNLFDVAQPEDFYPWLDYWNETYLVKYWDVKWHQYLKERLDRIDELGFDGVFLDNAYNYSDWYARYY